MSSYAEHRPRAGHRFRFTNSKKQQCYDCGGHFPSISKTCQAWRQDGVYSIRLAYTLNPDKDMFETDANLADIAGVDIAGSGSNGITRDLEFVFTNQRQAIEARRRFVSYQNFQLKVSQLGRACV